jgi:hypothetical protein
MSAERNIHFNRQENQEQPKVFPRVPRVNLNILMEKAKEEQKKIKRNDLVIFLSVFSVMAVFGIILIL